MVSGNVHYLEQHGPAVATDLPYTVHTTDRIEGLRMFQLGGRKGVAGPKGGRLTPVYYLADHDRDTVLKIFLDENPHLVDTKSRQGVCAAIREHGPSWHQVARRVTAEYYDEERRDRAHGHHTEGETRECALCGIDVVKNQYPDHLAAECERT